MKTVFLVGYMCCGKTTLGSAVAAELGVPFVDLDEWVERRAGCSVREIFATQGETAFRRMERAALREVASGDGRGAIVACGGGTPCQRGNMALALLRPGATALRLHAHRNSARDGGHCPPSRCDIAHENCCALKPIGLREVISPALCGALRLRCARCRCLWATCRSRAGPTGCSSPRWGRRQRGARRGCRCSR